MRKRIEEVVKEEAKKLYSKSSYADWVQQVEGKRVMNYVSEDGKIDVEVQAFWDEPKQKTIRVIVSGSSRSSFFSAVFPVSVDFIVTPGIGS